MGARNLRPPSFPSQVDVVGGRKYNPQQIHQVEQIVSEHTSQTGERRFGIKWEGWDH